ncbi:hypothetical protein Ndes2526B_g03449 [Nannochloris sp. 'desiccata']|nr:hypothetical protein NADE_005198 [Chlorella desiccata (nom. nud.)]
MKVAILLVALVTMVASRELKQIGIAFEVCPPLVLKNCCQNFDFGEITELHSGKAWPAEASCEFELKATVPVGIRPLDKPLKKKDDIHAYVDIEVEESTVDLVTTVSWDLFKYAPPNNVWTAGDGVFCLCPSPDAAVETVSTAEVVVIAGDVEDDTETVAEVDVADRPRPGVAAVVADSP